MPRKPLLAALAAVVSAGAFGPTLLSALPSAGEPPPWSSPEAAGLDPAALQKLVEGARATRADALVVVKDGRRVLDERFGTPDGPIEAMSVTKSVVSLAVGLLLDEGRLRSLDQPISEFYPEWKQGKKRLITLRQILGHTSGLQDELSTQTEIYPSPDMVQLALAAELSSDPGSVWAYNNKAVNLLSGIAKKASGQPLDDYLRDRLFTPLGITDYRWTRDEAGNPLAFAGLQIRPGDLARIGEMLADGGLWRGRRIISRAWIGASALEEGQELNPSNGLLWWLAGGLEQGPLIDAQGLARLRGAGVDPAFVETAARLEGRVARTEHEAYAQVEEVLGPGGVDRWMKEVIGRGIRPRHRRLRPPTGFAAMGYRGQYLLVLPRDRLVVVCMHRVRGKAGASFGEEQLDFPEFTALAAALLRSAEPGPN